ncbi:MAG: hypothetical protein HOY75_27450 [Streptomyces sp.]|nr:hypothetical protein [Streptomyces sp.]
MSAAVRVAHAAETIRARWELRTVDSPQVEAAQALEDTGQLLDPEVAAELKSSRVDWQRLHRAEQRRAELEAVLGTHRKDDQAEIERLKARVAELEAERHSTNESLSEAAEQLRVDRDRIAELEKREAIVTEFVAARAEVITAIRNCHPDNAHDYNRWQGHAESRRQLAESLGLPVAWPPESAK